MRKLSWVLIVGLWSCGLSHPTIPEFDAEAWANDKRGCAEIRQAGVDQLYEYKEMLIGYNQNQIKHYLGKPDEQELYNRSQTFFHYYVSGHEECGATGDSPVILQIRFNALNSSNEVYFRNYTP